MENQYKAQKVGETRWVYRGVSMTYNRDAKKYDPWRFNVRDVASPAWAANVNRVYNPFQYGATTKKRAIAKIDEMYEKGQLV